jgi:hypothetical protein
MEHRGGHVRKLTHLCDSHILDSFITFDRPQVSGPILDAIDPWSFRELRLRLKLIVEIRLPCVAWLGA